MGTVFRSTGVLHLGDQACQQEQEEEGPGHGVLRAGSRSRTHKGRLRALGGVVLAAKPHGLQTNQADTLQGLRMGLRVLS